MRHHIDQLAIYTADQLNSQFVVFLVSEETRHMILVCFSLLCEYVVLYESGNLNESFATTWARWEIFRYEDEHKI